MEEKRHPSLPLEIKTILSQLKEMSESGKINFAFAFTWPDEKGQYWFEAHTGGTLQILKPLFEDDTNAEALAKLELLNKEAGDPVYFSTEPSLLTVES